MLTYYNIMVTCNNYDSSMIMLQSCQYHYSNLSQWLLINMSIVLFSSFIMLSRMLLNSFIKIRNLKDTITWSLKDKITWSMNYITFFYCHYAYLNITGQIIVWIENSYKSKQLDFKFKLSKVLGNRHLSRRFQADKGVSGRQIGQQQNTICACSIIW